MVGVVMAVGAAAHPLAGPAFDPAELLDVDVHELAGALALVAPGRLKSEATKPAHADPGEDAGHGLLGHRQQLGDRSPSEAKPTQRGDRLDALLGGAVGHPKWRRRAVHQAGLPLGPEAARPLAGGALAHLGGRGRLAERPSFIDDPPGQQATLVQTEGGVSVEFHPVSSLGLSGLSTSQPPRRPG